MADRYAIGGGWTLSTNWSATSGGAPLGAGGVPVDGDKVFFDANSVDMGMAANSNALAAIDMTGYTGTLSGAHTVNVDNLGLGAGNEAILAGNINDVSFTISGSFEKSGTGIGSSGHPVTITQDAAGAGDETITTDGESGGYDHLVIDNNGITSLTAQDAPKWGSFDLAANGRYAGQAFGHNIRGNLLIDNAANVFTQTGVWTQADDGNVSNPNMANIFHNLSRGDGVDSTLTGKVWVKRLSGAGRIILDDQILAFAFGAVNDFYTATCEYTATTGEVKIYGGAADQTNAAAMDFGAVKVSYGMASAVRQLAVAGRFTCGILFVTGNGVANINRLVANGGLDASGLITLGTVGTAKFGGLTLAGSCSMGAGLVCVGTSVANELNLGSAHLSLTGEIDGVNAATGAIVPTNVAASVYGGTVTDLDCSGTEELTTFGSTLNNCTNVTNDTHAPPGSLALMGVGR